MTVEEPDLTVDYQRIAAADVLEVAAVTHTWTGNQWAAKVHYGDGTVELSDSFREGLIAALVPVLVEAQKRATEQATEQTS